jgi:hypothetical protein
MTMTKKNIHVVPQGDRWAVKKEGVPKPISLHNKKTTAVEKAVKEAKKAGVENVIHRKDGVITNKETYAKRDPNPPKDTEH